MNKLTSPICTHEIDGQTLRFGRLTLGAAVEIEEYLSTLPTPFEALENSKTLQHIDPELRENLIQQKLQQLHFWPPDALTALSTPNFLTSAKFGMAFMVAMITAFNAHIATDEAKRLAGRANHEDFMIIHRISLGLSDTPAPKVEAPAGIATAPPSGSHGAESSHG